MKITCQNVKSSEYFFVPLKTVSSGFTRNSRNCSPIVLMTQLSLILAVLAAEIVSVLVSLLPSTAASLAVGLTSTGIVVVTDGSDDAWVVQPDASAALPVDGAQSRLVRTVRDPCCSCTRSGSEVLIGSPSSAAVKLSVDPTTAGAPAARDRKDTVVSPR